MPHLHAATDDPTAQRARRHLVAGCQQRGILLLDGHNSFVNAAHNHDDVRRTADAIHAAARAADPDRPHPHPHPQSDARLAPAR